MDTFDCHLPIVPLTPVLTVHASLNTKTATSFGVPILPNCHSLPSNHLPILGRRVQAHALITSHFTVSMAQHGINHIPFPPRPPPSCTFLRPRTRHRLIPVAHSPHTTAFHGFHPWCIAAPIKYRNLLILNPASQPVRKLWGGHTECETSSPPLSVVTHPCHGREGDPG
jgi:hypothetical protein